MTERAHLQAVATLARGRVGDLRVRAELGPGDPRRAWDRRRSSTPVARRVPPARVASRRPATSSDAAGASARLISVRSEHPTVPRAAIRTTSRVVFEALAFSSHLTKLSDEDAEFLYPGKSVDDVLDLLIDGGVAVAAITRGEQGRHSRERRRSRLTVPAVRTARRRHGRRRRLLHGRAHLGARLRRRRLGRGTGLAPTGSRAIGAYGRTRGGDHRLPARRRPALREPSSGRPDSPFAPHHGRDGAPPLSHDLKGEPMPSSNSYDVTTWPVGDAADGHRRGDQQHHRRHQGPAGGHGSRGGKPGAVIYIPPGDYRLRTQVRDRHQLPPDRRVGHGFTSSSIRFNVPEDEWPDLHELWPGGSRILVDIPAGPRRTSRRVPPSTSNASGSPRISSVEFSNFCIDGLHFDADGSELHPENTYVNGKTGIYVASANDSFRVNGMGFIYLEHALTIYNADALSIHDNFIAECGSCIELRGWGQASKITDNLIGAGFRGALDLRREPRRAPDHREQRLPPRCEQRAPQRRHAFQRDEQPPALVLSRHGGSRREQLREPRGHEPLPP